MPDITHSPLNFSLWDAIRRALTTGGTPSTDSRVRFVSADAHRNAGGAIRQDLVDKEGEGHLTDVPLLADFFAKIVSSVAAELVAEGWSWVDIVPDADFDLLAGFKHLHPERTDSDQAELDRLSQEYDQLIDSDDVDAARVDEIEERIEVLRGNDIWSSETLAIAGAVIALDDHGDMRIERGVLRKEDAHKLDADAD